MDQQRPTMVRYAGVSCKSIIRTSREGFREAAVVSASKKNERMRQVQEKRRAEIAEMDPDDRAAVAAMDLDTMGSMAHTNSVQNIAPPREELEISHEGGDFEVFTDIAKTIVFATGGCVSIQPQNSIGLLHRLIYDRKYADYRDRRN